MSKRCICGICLTPPHVFALDCKHILCRECFSIWPAVGNTCPRCYIEDARDRLSTSGANEHAFDRLVQMFSVKTKELLAAKQDVLLSESFPTSVREKSPSTRDDGVHQYKGNDLYSESSKVNILNTGGQKRRATTDGSSTQVDSDDSDDELPAPFDARKRQRTTATPNVDFTITRTIDKERVLLRKTEELKTQLDKTYVDLESREKTYKQHLAAMKQRSGDMTKQAKDISSETADEARRQADRIKGLVADLNNQYTKLAAAKKTIQEFKSRAEEDKVALRKAEKRAIEFEAWGRQTKAHYQDIIRQMEANQPRSGTATRSSSHVREYLKELPTLRPIQALDDLDDDETNLRTPIKRRESAPIIMTPLRKSLNNHVDLSLHRQQLAMLESD